MLFHAASLALVEVPLALFPHQSSENGRTSFTGSDSGHYFLWQFVPILWTTLLSIMWDALDENVRKLQPFFLMARDQGASVQESLTLDYVTMFAYYTPFRAVLDRHWLVALSSTGRLLALAGLPALAGQMWNITWSIEGTATVSFQLPWLRVFQAANALLIAIIIVLLIILRSRHTGLARDPGGTANVTSIISQSPAVLDLLQRLPSYASHKKIQSELGDVRLHLRQAGKIEVLNTMTQTKDPTSSDQWVPSRREAHPFMLWGRWILITIIVIAIPNFIVRTGYGSPGSFKPFVVKGAFTLVYGLYTAWFQTVQHEMSVLEPYYQMRSTKDRRHMPITLDYTPRCLPWMPILALRTGAKTLAAASLMSMFQQLSMIFYPPIWTAIYENRLRGVYLAAPVMVVPAWIVFGSSIVVTICYIITFVAVFRKRRKPIMPRQVRTLASQMIYVCGSSELLRSMQGTANMNETDFQKHCENLGRGHDYSFGWFVAEGGKWRIGVEQADKVKYEYKYPETTSPERYDD